MKAKNVSKIRYTTKFWSPFLDYDDPIVTIVYTLTNDDKLIIKEYHGKKRKLYSTETRILSRETFISVAEHICGAINSFNQVDSICDGRSGRLRIYCNDETIDVDGEIGNGAISIDDIMNAFLKDFVLNEYPTTFID